VLGRAQTRDVELMQYVTMVRCGLHNMRERSGIEIDFVLEEFRRKERDGDKSKKIGRRNKRKTHS